MAPIKHIDGGMVLTSINQVTCVVNLVTDEAVRCDQEAVLKFSAGWGLLSGLPARGMLRYAAFSTERGIYIHDKQTKTTTWQEEKWIYGGPCPPLDPRTKS